MPQVGDTRIDAEGTTWIVVEVHQNGYSENIVTLGQSAIDRQAVEQANAVKQSNRNRLDQIDIDSGCGRTVREILIGMDKKGFNNKLEVLENEAIALRANI